MSTPAQTGARAEVVYVLGAKGSPTVKIGRTTNLAKRFADIQRMSPVPLTVLWTHPGGHELETNLHRHFKTVRTHGEWFTFSEDPVEHIRRAVETRPWLHPRRPAAKTKRAQATVVDVRPTYSPQLLAQQVARIHQTRQMILTGLESITDPLDRLHALEELEALLTGSLSTVRQQSVLNMKAGRTWRSVGQLIGVSGARAEQISRRAR